MKIVLWMTDEPNQRALANKINDISNVAGIVLQENKAVRKITGKNLKKLPDKIFEKVFLPDIAKSWWGLQYQYATQYPKYPDVPVIFVNNINDPETAKFTKLLNADLICVSGTAMVRKKLLKAFAGKKIINLHTGISPFIKGGPNCTNWCIAEQKFHLIGNTIMWINEGIDTGNIIATEATSFQPLDSLLGLHMQVMDHAHDLYTRAVKKIVAGDAVQNVPQDSLGTGITYYSREWNLQKKRALVRNFASFKKHYNNAALKELQQRIKLVHL